MSYLQNEHPAVALRFDVVWSQAIESSAVPIREHSWANYQVTGEEGNHEVLVIFLAWILDDHKISGSFGIPMEVFAIPMTGDRLETLVGVFEENTIRFLARIVQVATEAAITSQAKG